jgi:phage gp36-like protein
VLIDTYLRKRYQVPLAVAPAEISRAACMLARYDLSHGENKEPSEQTRLARKEVIDWLGQITRGEVLLDLAEVEPGDDSYAQMQDRPQMFGGWP